MRVKRGYTREVPVELLRDYKLFAIACEGGVREPAYFKLFSYMSRKVTVDVIEEVISDEEMATIHQNRSAPKWVLDRAMRYVDKEGLSAEDELWFVLDKDRWSDEQLREIFQYCGQQPNWNIVISNPCFEVWLYFHKKENILISDSESCANFKKEISNFTKGGYHPLDYIADINQAAINARKSDPDTSHFMPIHKVTKVYMLAESIMTFVGKNDLTDFINVKLPVLLKKHKKNLLKSNE